jgi:uncharacterized protein (TIGR02145 family)
MRNSLFVLIALTAPLLFSCAESSEIEAADLVACGTYDPSKQMCDRRDGKKYKIVKMPGDKFWMAENLNYEILDSKCYEDKEENCNIYGRLYLWNDRDILCPEGWKIPDGVRDWDVMSNEVDDDELKAKDGWDYNPNNRNSHGFSALPGGAYFVKYMGQNVDIFGEGSSECNDLKPSDFDEWGDVKSLGKIAVFMTSSNIYPFVISNEDELRFCIAKNAYMSVRCIKE